jgi:hypothetical protein
LSQEGAVVEVKAGTLKPGVKDSVLKPLPAAMNEHHNPKQPQKNITPNGVWAPAVVTDKPGIEFPGLIQRPVTIKFDELRILRQVGEGGFGTVGDFGGVGLSYCPLILPV